MSRQSDFRLSIWGMHDYRGIRCRSWVIVIRKTTKKKLGSKQGLDYQYTIYIFWPSEWVFACNLWCLGVCYNPLWRKGLKWRVRFEESTNGSLSRLGDRSCWWRSKRFLRCFSRRCRFDFNYSSVMAIKLGQPSLINLVPSIMKILALRHRSI